jgi:hypothetical protein
MDERHPVTQSTTRSLSISAPVQYGSMLYNLFAGIVWTLYNLISKGSAFLKVCLVDFPTLSH